jgi:6-phosphofructokinase 1
MRIAISTGGGDAPGLNAVIRAIVMSAHARGWETFGIQRGFAGLLGDAKVVPLGPDEVRGITALGGTILGTTNRGSPFRYPVRQSDGSFIETDRSADLVGAFRGYGFDCLVSIGGDGSLQLAGQLAQLGIKVLCVPKTIDNDIEGTEITFGFASAVRTATEAIDKLHSTAESHERVMVVELMGRHAGWISLASGIAGSADVILLPEIPFDIGRVCEKIVQREMAGLRYSIVVVAEGARPRDGAIALREKAGIGTVDRLGGIGARVGEAIGERTGKEVRSLVLGHLQRGGGPTTSDRILALRLGAAAVRAIADAEYGVMVAVRGQAIVRVPIADVTGRQKLVPPDSDLLTTARDLGISFGD